MKKEVGFGYCGLVCALCKENKHCEGCKKGDCEDKMECKSYQCCRAKGYAYCSECASFPCSDSILQNQRIAAFCHVLSIHGEQQVMTMLEKKEREGMQYHREGHIGDYDQYANEIDLRVHALSFYQDVDIFQTDFKIEDAFYSIQRKEYERDQVVHWVLYDKQIQRFIGTMDSYHQEKEQVLLRMDVHDDLEDETIFYRILNLFLPMIYEVFACKRILTAVSTQARKQRTVLERLGFTLLNDDDSNCDQRRDDVVYVRKR